MSGYNTPSKAPKSMSSRLLTMKFMQRAASIPLPPSPSTPDAPSPKRQKTGWKTPPKFDVGALADHKTIQAALELEEAKRQAAVDKAAAAAGETRWTLDFEPTPVLEGARKSSIRVVQTGFSLIDKSKDLRAATAEGDEDEDENGIRPALAGRKSFGKFNRTIEKLHNRGLDVSDSEGSDDNSGSSDEDDDYDESADALIKQEQGYDMHDSHEAAEIYKEQRRKKLKAERREAVKLANERKKKLIKMNSRDDKDAMPKTISGGNHNRPDARACYNCNQVGHLSSDCPEPQRKRRREDFNSPGPRKSRMSG